MTMTRLMLVASLTVSAGALGCKETRRDAQAASPGLAAASREEGKSEHHEEKPDRVELGSDALRELRLQLYRVEERELAPALEVSAELVPDPDRRADVGARTAARVVQLEVRPGDRVERGAALAVLESAEAGKARVELESSLARAEVARAAHARERSLAEVRATSLREVQEAEARQVTADAEVAAARMLLATLGAPSRGEASASDPARLVLRSPIRGTVVARRAHLGQSVAPSDTLVEIVDLDRLWLQAQVHEREMRFVAPGQPVHVETRAYPGEVFRGKVDRVGDVLDDRTRAVGVRVSLPNPDHRLKPGMFATARIIGTRARESRRMLAVPWAAVQEIDGHPSVFVRDGDRAFALRRVHTGERAGDLVEILNGVAIGDEVVTAGSFLLKGELLKSTLGGED